ncbi:MAG TPA: C10 family peptidase [Mucilaginibacter sp.]|nr:C10 family peptidase [Mucilaginibacter sp.]
MAAKDLNFVSLAAAAKAAKQVNNSRLLSGIITKKIIQSTSGLSGRPILDSLAVPDNVNPSYYIFNYVGGGYTVIAADKRVEPILSYSNTGYFPHSGRLPWGLANWLSVNHNNMQLLRKNPALPTPTGIASLWNELAVIDSGGGKVVDVAQPPPPPCEPTTTVQTVGPLTTTTWGQSRPYNYLCPTDPKPSDGFMPTGCVATAMAQLMYYWKAPAKYNWSLMPLTTNDNPISYPGNRDVAQLMADAGSSVDMLYFDSGSYPFPIIATSISSALTSTFGYGSAADASYNYFNVVSNLNAHEPVILGGTDDNTTILFWSFGEDGHAWVSDGYEQINTTWCPSNGNPGGGEGYLYLDMNWGWDGLSNTWYDFNYWSVFTGPGNTDPKNWQYNQVMTYNIHP